MKNGNRPVLDLSGFVGQGLPVKVDDYEFSIPLDMPSPMFAEVVRALSVIGGALQGEDIPKEKVVEANDKLWALTEELMAGAQPPAPRPVRGGVFNDATMLSFLGSVAKEFGAVTNSTVSSVSPTSTAVPSA